MALPATRAEIVPPTARATGLVIIPLGPRLREVDERELETRERETREGTSEEEEWSPSGQIDELVGDRSDFFPTCLEGIEKEAEGEGRASKAAAHEAMSVFITLKIFNIKVVIFLVYSRTIYQANHKRS